MITENTIKTATAIYTGGGIYIYYGQLNNGLYFRACDDFDFISLCDADTSTEEADYCEFYEEHEKASITGSTFEESWNAVLLWIIHNEPDGNYWVSDLEGRLL
jgi:hypothetical protein